MASLEVEYVIREVDTNYPESRCLRVIECFNQKYFFHYWLVGFVQSSSDTQHKSKALSQVEMSLLCLQRSSLERCHSEVAVLR